ncbi:MAG: hypothetical protein FIA99_05620 [Ruminiclostridium sp.]|nr:hypothetical protein [Ruminiclostridium sp.]
MLKKFIPWSGKIKFKSLLIFISVFLATICTFTIMLESYISTISFIENEVDKNNKSNLIQMEKKLANNMYRIKKITEVITNNQLIIDSIIDHETNPNALKLKIRNSLNAFLIKMMGFSDYIESVSLLTNSFGIYPGSNYSFMYTYKDIVNAGFEESLKDPENGNAVFYEAAREDDGTQVSNMEFINKLKKSNYFSRIIKYKGVVYGRIFIIIKPEAIAKIFKDNRSYMICNSDNSTIWKAKDISDSDEQDVKDAITKESVLDILKVDADNKKVYVMNSSFNDWKLAYLFDRQGIRQKTSMLGAFFAIAFIFTLIVAFLFSHLISRKITSPLTSLIKLINRYSSKIETDNNTFGDKKNRTLTIRESIMYFMIGVIFLPLLLYSAFSYLYTSRIIEASITESNISTFNVISENLNNFITDREKVMKGIANDSIIQEIFLKDTNNDSQFLKAQQIIDIYTQLNEGRDEVLLSDTENRLLHFYSYYQYKGENGFENQGFVQPESGKYGWTGVYRDRFNTLLLSLTIRILNIRTNDKLGFINASILESSLENVYKTYKNDNMDFFIVDDKNIIISHANKNDIGTKLNLPQNFEGVISKNEEGFTLKSKLINGNYYFIGSYGFNLTEAKTKQLFNQKVYIIIMTLFIAVILSYLISFSVTSSLSKMNRLLKKLCINDMGEMFPQDGSIYEINQLGAAFNEMSLRIETLIDEILIKNKEQIVLINKKRDAEMVALQSQINPHFLYNTFEGANWLIKQGNTQKAVRMLQLLCEFLRYCARSNNMIVTILEEIEYLKLYVEIMRMRLSDNFEFRLDIDESIMACKLNKLILQPIVENAIYHGIIPKKHTGIIEVKAFPDGDELVIRIYDDGIGIEDNRLDNINQELDSGNYAEHIGLKNVQTRIRLLFGASYGLKIKKFQPTGTMAEIRIPKII